MTKNTALSSLAMFVVYPGSVTLNDTAQVRAGHNDETKTKHKEREKR